MPYFRIVLAVLSFIYPACESFAVPGAGTIMISKKKQENLEYVYSVLIADHSHSERGFASFGGRIKEHEDPRDTAVRESIEESRNQYSQEELEGSIAKAQPVKQGEFTAYVVLVRHIPEKEFEKASTDCEDCNERKAYKWIPVYELTEIIRNRNHQIPAGLLPQNAETDYLWVPFVEIYKKAIPVINRIVAEDIKAAEGNDYLTGQIVPKIE